MAGYSLLNVFMLGTVILAGQHRMISSVRRKVTPKPIFRRPFKGLKQLKMSFMPLIYIVLQRGAPLFAATVLLACYFFQFGKGLREELIPSLQFPRHRDPGGFYAGAYLPNVQEKNSLQPFTDFQRKSASRLQIVSIYTFWGPEGLRQFPDKLLQEIAARGAIPMITWEPWVGGFPERLDNPGLKKEINGLKAIAEGTFDDYIKEYALRIRSFDKPVFIRFAHEPDNPQYPWSKTGNNTPDQYKAAWQKVVSVFAALGVGNVTWVWNPWDPGSMKKYYPGDQYVDWVGLTCLNYGEASPDKRWLSFEQIYDPYRNQLLTLHKPVMLAEFGSTNYGGEGTQWINKSILTIHDRYPEVKSVVFFNSDKDKNWVTAWRPSPSSAYIDWSLKNPGLIAGSLKLLAGNHTPSRVLRESVKARSESATVTPGRSTVLGGTPGRFELLVDGKPFYIKGIAYNAGHEWRDGNYPPTRRQLEKDFAEIKNTGANTIRRYHPSIYDRNILTIAGEYGLKVLYGFSFDPAVDYYKDTARVKKNIEDVVQNVSRYKGYSSLLGWSVGNETSGLLKKHYDQPYLNVVRKAYLQMVESIAKRIHGIDPDRPVFTSLEHSWQLPAELYYYHQLVPSVDVIGINSYYEQQISKLQQLTHHFDSTRPYLVSEFGPSGYWIPQYSSYNQLKEIKEDNERNKAALYSSEWHNEILKNRGYNVGGIAFCWRDRFEGTATWFGITDFKGRKKPVYYALQDAWKGSTMQILPHNPFITGPDFRIKPGASYEFKVIYENPAFRHIEWRLFSNDYAEEITVNTQNNYQTVLVTLPRKEQNYRLYVYVSDDRGNVLTASKSLNIYWPKKGSL